MSIHEKRAPTVPLTSYDTKRRSLLKMRYFHFTKVVDPRKLDLRQK